MSKPTLFDFINDLSFDKVNLLSEEDNEKLVQPYMINKALSMNMDTVLYADQMNRLYDLPKKMQYDYLFHSIRKRKRYGKWAKKDDQTILAMVAEHYQCSFNKARKMMQLMTPQQLETIKVLSDKGD